MTIILHMPDETANKAIQMSTEAEFENLEEFFEMLITQRDRELHVQGSLSTGDQRVKCHQALCTEERPRFENREPYQLDPGR